MIAADDGSLTAALDQVCRALGAHLAVVVDAEGRTTPAVLAAAPATLLPPGAPWPLRPSVVERTGPTVEHDPVGLAALVPTSVRLALGAPPVAVHHARLPTVRAELLVVWADDAGVADEPAIRAAIDTATLARRTAQRRLHLAAEADAVRLRAVLATLGDALVMIDDAGDKGYLNAAAAELLGLAHGEVAGAVLAEAVGRLRRRARDPDALERTANEALARPEARIDGWLWELDGSPTHLRVSTSPLRGAGLSGRIWVFEDVSNEQRLLDQEKVARQDAEAASAALVASEGRLREAQALLRTTFDALMDPCVLLVAERDGDRIVDFRCVEANRAAFEDQGLGTGDLVGSRLGERFPDVDLGVLIEAWATVVDGGRPLVIDDLVSPDGILHQTRRYDVRSAKAGDGVVVTWRDVTERTMAAEALDRRARTDDLTGLPNRAEVLDQLGRRLASSHRSGELAALFCDVDHFKEVYDTLGHAAGDEVLRTIARRAPSVIRNDDVVGRMGGDEFLAVLDGVSDLDHAVRIAERLRTQVRRPIALEGGPLQIGLSVGVVLARPGETLDELLARADQAMYRAKQAGRDRVIPIG